MKKSIAYLFSFFATTSLMAQTETQKDLNDTTVVTIKAYKPILAESYKIPDTPDGDTSSTEPPVMEYSIRSQKAETDFEASTIKAVKIKDEALTKLYRTYVKLGLGNYNIYNGELYVNALRSKTGALGISASHLSGNPGLKDVQAAGYSRNKAALYGKYMLDHSTFSGEFNFDRNAVRYYGLSNQDSIVDAADLKQRFNTFGLNLNFASNYLNRDHIDYAAGITYSATSDLFDVNESDFILKGFAGKDLESFYLRTDVSFDYFKKSRSNFEGLSQYSDLSRHIIDVTPTLNFHKEKIDLVLGVDFAMDKNLETNVHLFPKIDFKFPVAENILYLFANVNGGIIKNTYRTVAEENPFVSSAIQLKNTISKLELKGGISGNFSSRVSFVGYVKYSTLSDMQLFYNDSLYTNKFDAAYVDGKVLDLHAEFSYHVGEKFLTTVLLDQYSYSMDFSQKAWHHPNTEVKLNMKYNLKDKLLVNFALYGRGGYYVRQQETLGYSEQSVKGFIDANLGLEYRYSKILSLFFNANNLGFSRYYYWSQYPTERFNVLGGITYSF